VLDALVQAATGTGLGGSWSSDRLSGVFGDDNLKLGPVLAVLSPLALECAWRRYGRVALAATWVALAVAILLAGSRAGWVSFALVSLAFCWRAAGDVRRFAATLAVAVVSIAAMAAAAYGLSDRFAARVDRTGAAGSADERGIDFALAGRLPIWHTALGMAAAHPVNGVGVRGFRYAYKDYAEAGDPWLDPATGRGASHPHQLLLEVLAETGGIGLLAWLAGAWLAFRAYLRAAAPVRARAFAPGLALGAMTFPLNSHFAFYSSFWALLFWWLIALYLAALAQADPPP
jgi:O-antigen ligase